MGLLSIFSGGPRRFVGRDAFNRNLLKHLQTTPQTLTQLRQHGITPERALEIEFFFYTNSGAKAAMLAAELARRGYKVESQRTASGEEPLHIITGWTTRMPMEKAALVAWTKDMCEAGFECDCEFDGWGTNADQVAP